ncbi:MAG: hypothetical protein HeimC3_32170 [Candidatus Heimdallarchaeota archaeon LC_3]|nr:MAG: hypothetical protein HeimC3_32170 [Candidatus Heimdallarchaeota archaeon LC_3]
MKYKFLVSFFLLVIIFISFQSSLVKNYFINTQEDIYDPNFSSKNSLNYSNENELIVTPTNIGENNNHVDFNPTSKIQSVFRENRGQMPEYITYYANIPQGTVGFGISKVSFMINDIFFQLDFLNSNQVQPIGVGKQQGYSNYFIGNQSFSKINHFSQVVYEDFIEGITLTYQITPQGLKYEFLVDPYADIMEIEMVYSGVENIRVTPTQVELKLAYNIKFVDEGLKVWYADTGEEIPCSFSSDKTLIGSFSTKSIQFSLPSSYDSSRPIVIDPFFLAYSSFIGEGVGYSMTLDSLNNIYVTGNTASSYFPTTNNTYDNTLGGTVDTFVIKLSADGSTLLYSTFLGGSSGEDSPSIVLDSLNNIYITGMTTSSDFPTVNAYDTTLNGTNDIFVTKLSANGSTLLYSTFLGGSGSDSGNTNRPSIILDSLNNAYIAILIR